MNQNVPRSGYDMVGGVIYFGRMLDKIRLHAAGVLPDDYNRGKGFDAVICRFLGIEYDALVARVAQGGSDEEILEWAYATGRRPSDDAIAHFNAYLQKRGWRDEYSPRLQANKERMGFGDRDDIQTSLDLIDADEGRPPRFPAS